MGYAIHTYNPPATDVLYYGLSQRAAVGVHEHHLLGGVPIESLVERTTDDGIDRSAAGSDHDTASEMTWYN